MQGSLGQLLCSCDGDAIDLIDDKWIVLWITTMQDYLWSAATCLYKHVSGTRVFVWVEVNPVAQPAEEPVTFDRCIVCLTVAIETLLAQRHPYPPKKRFLDPMDRNL